MFGEGRFQARLLKKGRGYFNGEVNFLFLEWYKQKFSVEMGDGCHKL